MELRTTAGLRKLYSRKIKKEVSIIHKNPLIINKNDIS